jgi:hypothetical protein
MSKLDKEEVISKFTEAYKSANGKEPSIEAKGGWYSVDGGKNIRLAQLSEMIDELSSGNNADSPKSAPAVEKKAKAKPAAPKATAKKPKQKKSGFSVKAYWAEKISESDSNNQSPR